MELDELQAIVQDWYRFGRISPDNKARMKEEAFRVGAADPEGCKTCPNFWNNVMHNLISYLRENNISIMKNQGKYIMVGGTGSFRIPFSDVQIVAEGVTTDTLKLVGDPENEPLIESILKEYPELESVILLNPNYKEPAPTETATNAPKARGRKPKAVAEAEDPEEPEGEDEEETESEETEEGESETV